MQKASELLSYTALDAQIASRIALIITAAGEKKSVHSQRAAAQRAREISQVSLSVSLTSTLVCILNGAAAVQGAAAAA